MAGASTGDTRRSADAITIRRAKPGDADGIGDVRLASWRATFDFELAHPDDDVRRWIATELIPHHETWVAVDGGGTVVALMALSDDMIEQLYVGPAWIGRGLGRRFVALAKEQGPAGLDLYRFAVNTKARRFYERAGFEPIAFGDGAGNMEHQPDVRYAWRPTT